MNWEAIGAVGEVMGALVVIATLVYLATQVREARRATAADIYQTRAMKRADAELHIALNCPTYHDIHFRFSAKVNAEGVEAALASMTEHECFLLARYYDSLMARLDNVCFQHKQGFIPDAYFDSVKNTISQTAPVWLGLGLGITPELRATLDSITTNS